MTKMITTRCLRLLIELSIFRLSITLIEEISTWEFSCQGMISLGTSWGRALTLNPGRSVQTVRVSWLRTPMVIGSSCLGGLLKRRHQSRSESTLTITWKRSGTCTLVSLNKSTLVGGKKWTICWISKENHLNNSNLENNNNKTVVKSLISWSNSLHQLKINTLNALKASISLKPRSNRLLKHWVKRHMFSRQTEY